MPCALSAKPKDLLAPGMSMSKAIEQAIRSMDRNGTGKVQAVQQRERESESER